MDAMTPDERRAEFDRRLITNPDELPAELREKIRATAERLARDRTKPA